jgi:hypothetical protein
MVVVIGYGKGRGESPHPIATIQEQHTVPSITYIERELPSGEHCAEIFIKDKNQRFSTILTSLQLFFYFWKHGTNRNRIVGDTFLI